jgi:hypothetical protein
VRDLSAAGATIDLARTAAVPDRFTLTLEMESATRVCIVVSRNERRLGVRFG